MKTQKFIGSTLKEVTEQMKKELGENAIIMNTRKVNQGGMFSFLKKDLLEVTATVEDLSNEISEIENINSSKTSFDDFLFNRIAADENGNKQNETKRKFTFPQINNEENKTQTSSSEISQIKGELDDVRSTLKEIVEQLKYSKMPSLPDNLKKHFITLVAQDVNEQIAANIVQKIYGQLSGDELSDSSVVENRLIDEISKIIMTVSSSQQKLNRAKILAFVGPTGVGKTTTIAKIAAINKLFNGFSVALISADTYRIAAIEQLRTFAAIANIEMEVVYRPGEVQKAIKKHRSKDLIIIDTFGRGQREEKGLSQLKKFIEAAEPDEVHLVLSAAATEKTMLDICERFDITKPNRLVFSKVDECVTFGQMLNLLYKIRIPISYITMGQTVPEDIVNADSKKIANMIYRSVIYDV